MAKKLDKKSFEMSYNDDGNIMNIHHTIMNGEGELIRIKFTHVIISDSNEMIVCVDHRQNIFVFNLISKKFWLIKDKFKSKCTVAKFLPGRNSQIMFGTRDGDFIRIDINVGVTIFEINAHDNAIIDIQFSPITMYSGTSNRTSSLSSPSSASPTSASISRKSSTKFKEHEKVMTSSMVTPSSSAPPPSTSNASVVANKNLLLTITKAEMKIFDFDTLAQCHKIDNGLKIIDANFIPNTTNIYAISNDNNIYIFNYNNIKNINLINKIPLLSNINKFHLNIINFANDEDTDNSDYSNSFSNNNNNNSGVGDCFPHYIIKSELICKYNLLYLLTNNNLLIIYDVIKFCIIKIIKLININIKNINLLLNKQQKVNNNLDGDMLVLIQTNANNLYMVNLNLASIKIKLNYSGSAYKIYSNIKNTKLFAVVLCDGEIVIETMGYYTRRINEHHKNLRELDRADSLCGKEELLQNVYRELKSSLPEPELHKILKEYGEFPIKYRSIIWRTILKLPQNTDLYLDLLRKGEHQCVENYSKMYPLRDISSLRNLKKIISCLAHWCILFSTVDYMAEFVFPFMKIFHNDVVTCMETIMVILMNHCAMWFEYYPLEPLNYLGMIEMILTHFDPGLIQFYIKHHITVTDYGYELMKNGMSIVLCDTDWMALWDHLILEKPYFLLFAIVAYNLMQKQQIVNLKSSVDVRNYFLEQNFCNRKQFLKKMYEINERCPENLHPRNFIADDLVYMEDGYYKKFLNYPKMLLEKNIKSMDKVRIENLRLENKMLQMEKQEKLLNERLNRDLVKEEHQKRLQEVQKQYAEALIHEQERIAHQRKLLSLYQKQARERQLEILDETRNCVLRKNLSSKESELDNLLKSLERNKIREETDIMIAEENFKQREMDILEKKLSIENQFYEKEDGKELSRRHKTTIRQLENERDKLMIELVTLNTSSTGDPVSDTVKHRKAYLTEKIFEIADLLEENA